MEQEQEQARGERKLPSRLVQGFVAVVVVIGFTCLGMYYWFSSSKTFAAGVEIGGVLVEDYSKEQAVAALGKSLEEFYAAKVTFYKDDYSLESKMGDLCEPASALEIVDRIWEQENSRSWQAKAANLASGKNISYPVPVEINADKKASLAAEWESKWGKAPQDASLDVDDLNGLVVVPGIAGYKVDIEQIFSGLPQTINKVEPLRLPVIIASVQPRVSADILQNMGELGSFSTYFNTGEINRSHNLRKAAASINKKVLEPGAVFSFNETVGQRTMEKGYLDAMVIVGNKFEPGLGGGICQVSSTLYNASLLAGLEIVERHNHNLAVAYVQVGRDATVNYGLQDYRFKNNTDRPIYIRVMTSGGKLLVNIYGNTEYKQHIEISSIIDKTLDFSTVTELDETLAPGQEVVNNKGQLGYVARSFRTFYDKNGKIVRTEQLDTDTYRPLNRLILKGPAVIPVSPLQPGEADSDENTRPAKPPRFSPDKPRGENERDETPLNRPTIQP